MKIKLTLNKGPVTTTPGPENFPEAEIQSAADFTGTLSPDTYPDSGFESQGTPVAVENIQYQDVVVAQAQPQQVKFRDPKTATYTRSL